MEILELLSVPGFVLDTILSVFISEGDVQSQHISLDTVFWPV